MFCVVTFALLSPRQQLFATHQNGPGEQWHQYHRIQPGSDRLDAPELQALHNLLHLAGRASRRLRSNQLRGWQEDLQRAAGQVPT